MHPLPWNTTTPPKSIFVGMGGGEDSCKCVVKNRRCGSSVRQRFHLGGSTISLGGSLQRRFSPSEKRFCAKYGDLGTKISEGLTATLDDVLPVVKVYFVISILRGVTAEMNVIIYKMM